jgi:hypothetical protein
MKIRRGRLSEGRDTKWSVGFCKVRRASERKRAEKILRGHTLWVAAVEAGGGALLAAGLIQLCNGGVSSSGSKK